MVHAGEATGWPSGVKLPFTMLAGDDVGEQDFISVIITN